MNSEVILYWFKKWSKCSGARFNWEMCYPIHFCLDQLSIHWCFFLFCVRLVELDELDEFNYNQLSMTESYWMIFCVSHSKLTLWCNGYHVWLVIRRSLDQASQKSFSYCKIFRYLIRWIQNMKKSITAKSWRHFFYAFPCKSMFATFPNL